MTSDQFERVRAALTTEPRPAHRVAYSARVPLTDTYHALVRLYDLGEAITVSSGLGKRDETRRWVCTAECRKAA